VVKDVHLDMADAYADLAAESGSVDGAGHQTDAPISSSHEELRSS
jgi:hypothetical protein